MTDGSRGAISDRMASDMEVQTKQRCVTEFLHLEKFAPTDTHQCLLNVSKRPTSGCEHSDLLVLIFDECSMQLSFIPGESALLMAVTVLKNSDL